MAVSRVNFRRRENTHDQRNIAEEAEATIGTLDPVSTKATQFSGTILLVLFKKQLRYIKAHIAAVSDGVQASPWSLINFST